jgi:hypothetical protein
MKVFQTIHSYRPYLDQFERKYRIDKEATNYEQLKANLLKDRFYAAHLLNPVLNSSSEGFYSMWDYPLLQHKWAEEKGWNETDLKKIIFAQIEDFKPDVFYNCSPIRFEPDEIKKNIPKEIAKVCWYASPETKQIDFSVYKSRLTNLPSDIKDFTEVGYRNDLFQPAHDSVMDQYVNGDSRPIDIFFYGQFIESYFKNRNRYIERLIDLKSKCSFNIEVALQYKFEYKQMLPIWAPGRIRRHFYKRVSPAKNIVQGSIAPLYGLDLYSKIASSKIVFNAGVDFSGEYKVNMRNFESLGLGAHLISDEGIYPNKFSSGENFTSYKNFDDFVEKATYLLNHEEERKAIAVAGHQMVKKDYSKENQWKRFKEIVAEL